MTRLVLSGPLCATTGGGSPWDAYPVARGLEVVQAKLRRARRELDGLTAELQEYDLRRPWSIDMDRDLKHAYVRLHEPLDPEWEVTVGSIAHHARSALDRLVTLVVIAAGGSAEAHEGQFPICTSMRAYHRLGKDGLSYRDRSLHGVPEGARRLIDAVQPFGETSHPLALLQRISNWDKHRDGQPAMSARRQSMFAFASEREQMLHVFANETPRTRTVADGDDLMAAFAPQEMLQVRRRLRELRAAEDKVPIEVFMRLGVCFGREGVFVFQLREVIEFIEGRVVAPLAPHVTHGGS